MLPVIESERVVGVVTRSDIVSWILKEPSRFSTTLENNSQESEKSQFYYNELLKGK